MTKPQMIRFLRSERCSAAEIALVVGYREKTMREILARPEARSPSKLERAFNSWRGVALSDRVISL